MKRQKVVRRLKMLFWTGLLAAYSVAATGVLIDVLGADYRQMSQVAATSAFSPLEQRIAGATQVAAAYRANSAAPFSALPTGSTFRIRWPDGSSEYISVISVSSSDGARPIPGTQRPAPGAGSRPE
jgi:hypothetical protein